MRHIMLAVLMMLGSLSAWAQRRVVVEPILDTARGFDTVILPRWEPHLYVATGFVGSDYFGSRVFTTVAPSVTYRPNARLEMNAGFRVTSDFGANKIFNVGAPVRSLAPYRHNESTGLVSAHVGAEYQVGDNVWLGASLYHLGGSYAPMYGFWGGNAVDVSVTALTAEAAFRFRNNNFLHLAVSIVRDQYGTLPFLYHDAFMYGGCRAWGFYGAPMGFCGSAMPYCGGWF